jgi:hypothetical protein
MSEELNLTLFGFLLFSILTLILLHLAAVADRTFVEKPLTIAQRPVASHSELLEHSNAQLQTERRRYEALQHAYQQLQQELAQHKVQLEQVSQAGIGANLRSPAATLATEDLQQECLRLQQTLEQQQKQLAEEWQYHTFDQLQTLLINYPSAQKIAQIKPDLPAKNLTALFAPLDNLLDDWGWEAIGSVWDQVPYNPQLHQADNSDIQPGEPVYVRFVGYRKEDSILCPAKVSRTLPSET